MIHSQSIIKIAPALVEAQKKIGSAKKGSVNPFFHSSYASLGDVMEACKDILNENGIAVLQPVGTDENGVFVETVLLHTSGEWIADRMKIAPKTDTNPQDQGSAISYARRYSLQSMVFIPSEDDDAEKAVNRNKVEEVKAESSSKYASQKDHFCKTHQRDLKFKQTPNGIIWEHYAQIDGVWNTCHGDGAWRPQQAKAELIPEVDINEQ